MGFQKLLCAMLAGFCCSAPGAAELLEFKPDSATRGTATPGRHAVEIDAQALAFPHVEIATPDGHRLRFATMHRTLHSHGITTWSGRDAQGASAVITVGPGAAFGELPSRGGAAWRIETRDGEAWLAEPRDALPANRGDWFPAPSMGGPRAKGGVPSVVVDVVVGFTTHLATRLGGVAQAEARVVHVMALANQALEDSDVPHRFRLVETVQVSYGSTVSNNLALQALTGVSCNPSCATVPVPAALQPLRDAREAHGGDLVVLMRPYTTPEQGDCGRAWLLGAGGFGIDATDAAYGYSVVSDGIDFNEGSGLNTACPATETAHQLGHNLGQQHNVEDSNSTGRHAYSYGYREAGSTGFYTIMAERLPNSSQFGIAHYGNPAITYANTGRPTGTAAANNARSMTDTMPVVSTFRTLVLAPLVFANGFE